MSEDRPAVFVIDDDPSMRRSLDTLLRSVALDVHIFSSTQEFMQRQAPDAPGGLLLQVRLPGHEPRQSRLHVQPLREYACGGL